MKISRLLLLIRIRVIAPNQNHRPVCILAVVVLAFLMSAGFRVAGQQKVPLWLDGAPGFESRKDEPELAKDYWVRNIHNPSLTVFLPPSQAATGAAVVVCPGGGHRELVYHAEGEEAALFLNGIGVAAFVLKYRLAREQNSPYTIEKDVSADIHRAMRLVRSRAAEWGIDPNRIGVMGFSAGGEVAALVAYGDGKGDPAALDAIDLASSKPDFQVLIYPGPHYLPETIPPNAPPAFMLAANDDPCCADPVIALLEKYHAAKVPVEAHIYAQGSHAFNMGNRSKLKTISSWPQRLADWLADNHFLN